MSGERRLIINADDFGLSEAVNRGILEAHEAGAVTSASLLVNAPGFDDAVCHARRAPRLGVGLHLNLTEGRPVSSPEQVRSLCNPSTGRFCGLPRLIARALAGRVVAAHVATECAAQIVRLQETGLRITHLDSHHHAHVLPGLWRPVVETARQAGIAALRMPVEPLRGMLWRPAAAVAQAFFTTCYRRAARETAPLRHPGHFRGFALTGRDDFLERLLEILDRLEPGVTELMVHPGYWDQALSGWGCLGRQREHELAALKSRVLRERLALGDIVLVHYGQL